MIHFNSTFLKLNLGTTMETIAMIYTLPMMLGRTFDMATNSPGVLIFPQESVNKNITIEHYFTDAQYRLVDNTDSLRDFLDVGGKLSLKIKSGNFNVKGEGSYLKDSSTKAHFLELLVKVRFETITQTLPFNGKTMPETTLMDKKYLGTHYCRSITFGGDLIASVRFTTSNSYDKERIKGALQGGLKAGSAFEAEINGHLEKLKSDALDTTSMEIRYYASVPIPGVSYTIEGLMDLVEHFPTHVQNVNGGFGAPLKMELYPLKSISKNFPSHVENRALNDILDDLEDHFDDIRSAKNEINSWLNSLPPEIPEKIQEMISDFVGKLDKIQNVFVQVIADMDLSVGASSTHSFEKAFEAYADGGSRLSMKYIRLFEKLKLKIYEDVPDLKPKIGGATYIQWGASGCANLNLVETVISGVAVGSENLQSGGPSDYSCIPTSPFLVDQHVRYYKSKSQDSTKYLTLSPLRYRSDLDDYGNQYGKAVACSICRSKERTAILIKMAATECPDLWSKEYEGILMAPAQNGSTKGQFICIDKNMTVVSETTFGSDEIAQAGSLHEVGFSNKSIIFGTNEEVTFLVPCVVCTY